MNRAAAPPWSSVHHSLSSRASLAGSSWWIAIAVVVLVAIAPTGLSHRTNDDGQEEAEWMAEVPGGLVMARQIAAHHGLHLREQDAWAFPDVFVFRHRPSDVTTTTTTTTLSPEDQQRLKRDARARDQLLADDHRVRWSQRQIAHVRQKRDYIEHEQQQQQTDLDGRKQAHSHREVTEPETMSVSDGQTTNDAGTLILPLAAQAQPHYPNQLAMLEHVLSQSPLFPLLPAGSLHPSAFESRLATSELLSLPLPSSPESSSSSLNFNDPQFGNQWYLLEGAALAGGGGRSMRSMSGTEPSVKPINLNVLPVWKSGLTGRGVVVTILDDGVETNHTDLIHNYDPDASTDVNGGDRDPTPRYDNPEDTHHGTRCAGEVAMQANNNICGVGIAFNAKIGGIRMLDGSVTDRVEAEAFSFNNNYIDIYSSSWGPSDDGRTVEAPGLMASRALEKGVQEGRQGKGVIYVWASGNGGISGDSCAFDGYASNINTLSIGSATEHAHFPIYGEICSSTMAVTYSSGSLTEGKIVSSDILNGCTTEHTGTSASAPLAAGMIALALEANPDLTWRDMKHVVAWSADPFPLLNNPGWSLNGEGLLVSPAFGFGLMDAERLVTVAKLWQTAPPKVKCVVRKTGIEEAIFTQKRPLQIAVRTQACQGTPNAINHLEQVEVIVSLSHAKRGATRIFLTSPAGTKSLIAPRRDMDMSRDGLNGWSFVSVHNWAENPLGVWTVNMESHMNESTGGGTLHSLRLVFHGTKDGPPSLQLVRDWRAESSPTLQSALAPQPVSVPESGDPHLPPPPPPATSVVAIILPVTIPPPSSSNSSSNGSLEHVVAASGVAVNGTATTSSTGLLAWIRRTIDVLLTNSTRRMSAMWLPSVSTLTPRGDRFFPDDYRVLMEFLDLENQGSAFQESSGFTHFTTMEEYSPVPSDQDSECSLELLHSPMQSHVGDASSSDHGGSRSEGFFNGSDFSSCYGSYPQTATSPSAQARSAYSVGTLITIPETPALFSKIEAPVCTFQPLKEKDMPRQQPRSGRVFSEAQVDRLMLQFRESPQIGEYEAACLAKELAITPIQVKTWFANRRNREKLLATRKPFQMTITAAKSSPAPKPVKPPKKRPAHFTPPALSAVISSSKPLGDDQPTNISIICREMYCGGGATIAPASPAFDGLLQLPGDASRWLSVFNQEHCIAHPFNGNAVEPGPGVAGKGPSTVTGKALDLSFLPAVDAIPPGIVDQPSLDPLNISPL